jgi:hypothetical protein
MANMNIRTANKLRNISSVLSIILAACVSAQRSATPVPQIADESLLNPSQCTSPCWHGLVPGESNRQDAIDFLKIDPLVAGNYEADGATAKPGVWWWWAGEEHESHRTNRFIFESDLLLEIWLVPNKDTALKRVLDANGAPDLFTIALRRYEDGSMPGYDLEVSYFQLGALITWHYVDNRLPYDGPSVSVCPDPSYPASEVVYLTEENTRHGIEVFPPHTTGHGRTAFPGNELATKDGDSWSVGCFDIASH